MAGDVVALVPMKPVPDAKTRLAGHLPPGLRHAAVLFMLHRVVSAAAEALGRGAAWVIGGDALVRQVAQDAGAIWQPERDVGLNACLWAAMQDAYREGWRATLFLPSDLPMASPGDILRVVSASGGLRAPVGVRAQADGGTNALLVPAVCAFRPTLGHESFAAHRQAALLQGTPLVEVEAPSLARDVDSADDLRWARHNVQGFETGLQQWHDWLVREHPSLAHEQPTLQSFPRGEQQ